MEKVAAREPAFTEAFIGLGSNIGDPKMNILRALQALSDTRGILLRAVSTLLETDAIGLGDQPGFLNGVAEISTTLDPFKLRDACLEIERRMGRMRTGRWKPRVIDLDVLLYGKDVIRAPGLTVPHPEIANRPFVEAGLRELAASRG